MAEMTEIKSKARAGTAVRERGRERALDILAMAKTILVQEGLPSLTTRRVADELGISVGNLAYYFPSKDALLKAIIDHVIEGYDEELEQEFRTFPDDPTHRLKAFLRYLVRDTMKPEVQGFFYQFWGLTKTNVQVAVARQQMYEHFTGQLLQQLADIHPHRSMKELKNVALGMLACIEGLHVVFGTSDTFTEDNPGFDDYIFDQLLQIAGVATT